MTTQYAEEQGFKKKYLAPLIVLMLCAVSLTGAAYAYSTTISGNGNVNYDYYSIDLYSDDKGTAVVTTNLSSTDDFDVETYKTVGNNYFANVIGNTITFTTYVKVQSDKTETCYITGTATYKQQTGTADLYKAWTEDASKPTCTVTVNGGSTTQTNSTYAVTITVELKDINDFDLKVSTPDKVAEALKFVGTGCIEIKLTATGTAPTPSE